MAVNIYVADQFRGCCQAVVSDQFWNELNKKLHNEGSCLEAGYADT